MLSRRARVLRLFVRSLRRRSRRSSPKPSDVVALRLSFAGPWVALWTPPGSATPRAVPHHRTPFVCTRGTVPRCLEVRRFRKLLGLFLRVAKLLEESLPALTVGVAPRDEVVGLASRYLIRALRTSGGSVAPRAFVHLRPPLVPALLLRALPQRLVV
eukprot:31494-Pelagococcus_subviridis.AAC.4